MDDGEPPTPRGGASKCLFVLALYWLAAFAGACLNGTADALCHHETRPKDGRVTTKGTSRQQQINAPSAQHRSSAPIVTSPHPRAQLQGGRDCPGGSRHGEALRVLLPPGLDE